MTTIQREHLTFANISLAKLSKNLTVRFLGDNRLSFTQPHQQKTTRPRSLTSPPAPEQRIRLAPAETALDEFACIAGSYQQVKDG
jgi:hypothetical protein